MVVHAFEGGLGRVRLKVAPMFNNLPDGTVFLINGIVVKEFEEEEQPTALFEEILAYLTGLALGETWLIGPGEAMVCQSCQPDFEEWCATHPELLQVDGRIRVSIQA